MQDFPRAHNELTAAKKLAGDEVPFELNLNLAAVNMSLGFYENALELLNLSESELTEEETYELQFNRFVSLMRLNRQEEASALYAAIADDILARDVDPTKFSNLLAWSLIQQDPEVWLALRAKLEDALSEHNHGILFEPGDPSRLLFRAYDEEWQALGIEDSGTQRWRVVKQLWPGFDGDWAVLLHPKDYNCNERRIPCGAVGLFSGFAESVGTHCFGVLD
jgi:predicted negative regulator of RcsB-dependent stress response